VWQKTTGAKQVVPASREVVDRFVLLFVSGIGPGVDRSISSCESVVLRDRLPPLLRSPRLLLVTALSIGVVLRFVPEVVRAGV
jgi:hypothetical protein